MSLWSQSAQALDDNSVVLAKRKGYTFVTAKNGSKRWIEKVLEVFIEEVGQVPADPDEIKLQDKIMTIVQFRANGLDWRKVGLLAADIYQLTHSTRRRVINDLARVAVTHDKDETSAASASE